MSAQLVIDHIIEEQGININTLTDKDFSKFSWLNEREPISNMKGEKVSKSYFFENKKEAIRIVYGKIFGDFEYNGVLYPNVYLGWKKTMNWIDWAGEVGHSKSMQPYYFNLEPIFIGDGTETIVGFSSPKMRKSLKEERYAADDYLQAKNPQLYALLYYKYFRFYIDYLSTGVKTNFVNAINNESDVQVIEVLNKEVFRYEPMTVKELIIMNLQ
jgi:hypothetical protein